MWSVSIRIASVDCVIVSMSCRLLAASVDVTAPVPAYRTVLGAGSLMSMPLEWLSTLCLHAGQLFFLRNQWWRHDVWKVWLHGSFVVLSEFVGRSWQIGHLSAASACEAAVSAQSGAAGEDVPSACASAVLSECPAPDTASVSDSSASDTTSD